MKRSEMANDEIRDSDIRSTASSEHGRLSDSAGRIRFFLGVTFALAAICLGVIMLTYVSRI